ncbi:hypothetical protein MKX03_019467 [Papaver bracteatum]|nr:hypothetical protein MKX03_019467 [Papaver bracteatum]
MLSHLKYVEIKELQGCDNEVKLLQLLLGKAMVLEEVALFFRSTAGSPGRVKLKRFRDKLGAVTRASSSTNMMFF